MIFRNRWTTLLWALAICYLAVLIGGSLSADSPAPLVRMSERRAQAQPYAYDTPAASDPAMSAATAPASPPPQLIEEPEPVHGELPY